jgi:hypothetical protein
MLVGLDVNENAGAWGRDRCAIEVIVPMHLGPGQQHWVDPGATHEVESEDGLRRWSGKSGSVLHRSEMK